jgi:DNA polymerase-3 subunit delta
MAIDTILNEWKSRTFSPVYWLDGEEEYFIDKVVDYAEHNILNENEAAFNLTIFYGRDTGLGRCNQCVPRYPMFAERQVVVLKEAQHMRDIEKLEGYIEHPLSSTVFVVSYKDKKVDGRSKLAKLLKQKGCLHYHEKIFDSQLPEWTQELLQEKQLSITPKGLALLVDHIGNDLDRIENEIEKISVNPWQTKVDY